MEKIRAEACSNIIRNYRKLFPQTIKINDKAVYFLHSFLSNFSCPKNNFYSYVMIPTSLIEEIFYIVKTSKIQGTLRIAVC